MADQDWREAFRCMLNADPPRAARADSQRELAAWFYRFSLACRSARTGQAPMPSAAFDPMGFA